MALSKGAVSFAWQGGEPLLAGYDFFEEVIWLQTRYAPPGTHIANSVQTNGTLITEKFAEFFKKHNFLLGVSIDGPRPIHDARRVNFRGEGSFDRIMQRVALLEKHKVDFNVLSVIHKGNVGKASELFEFYRKHHFHYVQFIPCMNFQSQRVDQPGTYEITAQEFGDFLCEAFDYWFNDGNPTISVRFFDSLMNVYLDRGAELCAHAKSCGRTLILEQNGDAFPCDFYIHSDWKLGNVGSDSLKEIMANPLFDRFSSLKTTLPDRCKSCQWLKLCFGGCPRNRNWTPELDFCTPDFFCESYKRIYAYADARMEQLSVTVRRNLFNQNVARIHGGREPGRNETCACGSGKKYKNCCLRSN